MFRNSENWAIVIDICDNETQELSQLYNIWYKVYEVKMCDFYDYFSTLQWHIHWLEEKLNKSNPELNGDSLELDNSSIDLNGYDSAIKSFNNDTEALRKYLIDHIYIIHNEIDQMADLIPKMLSYWKQLKAERLSTPNCDVIRTLVTTHQGMVSYYSDTLYTNWDYLPNGEKIYHYAYPDPVFTLFHIDGNLPPDPSDSEDDYYEY